MKKTLRSAMLSTIAMLVVAVLSLTGVTYAWFTQGETATVNGMNVEVTAAEGGVQVRERKTDGSFTNWAATLNLATSLKEVKPVSTTNAVNFFQVDFDDADSTKYATIDATGNNVITKNIQLANPGAEDITVVLSADNSNITSAANSATNVSTEINKAARVALISGGKTYIWAPNDASYVGVKAASSTAADYTQVVNGVTENVTITEAGACEIKLLANTAMETSKFVDVQIVVWLEGQDSDCSNPNAGGAFDVQLQFVIKDEA